MPVRNALLIVCSLLFSGSVAAQPFLLAEGPWYYDTYSPAGKIKVSVVARGISNPWGMAFLPDGNILIAEQGGAFRLIRNGQLDPTPLPGAPEIKVASSGGLMDLVLHPDFADNRLVYFTYVRNAEPPAGAEYYATTALARGRLTRRRPQWRTSRMCSSRMPGVCNRAAMVRGCVSRRMVPCSCPRRSAVISTTRRTP